MTKILLDSEPVKKTVAEKISSVLCYLESASAQANFSIPRDFRYYSYLANLKFNIRDLKTNCNNFLNWATRSLTSWENLKLKLGNNCIQGDIIIIKRRNNLIK